MTPDEFNRQKLAAAWRELAEMPPIKERPLLPPLYEIRRSQTCPEFERMRSDQMVMGAFRYGFIGAPDKPAYDNLGSMERRIQIYRETGDLCLLGDIANLAMVEFVEGRHPLAHRSTGDSDEHVLPLG